MNKRSIEIFKARVENFICEMRRSSSIYEDLNRRNKLLHSGEYGIYKERTLKKLIEYIKPFKYDTTDGFIINSINETSTQCDLIIFDKLNTPLVNFGDRFQFIPAESVAAIGEVKSIITKNDFFEAAIKLSKIKAMCKPSEEYRELNSNFNEELFSPFSFLVCDSISGIGDKYTYKDLIRELVDRYKSENVDVNNYFNIVIVIFAKKAFGYRTSKPYMNPDVPVSTKIYYPKRFGDLMNGSIVDCADEYNLMREFAYALSSSLHQRPVYFPDPVNYLWD